MKGIKQRLGFVLSVAVLVASLPLSSNAQLTDPNAPHVGEVAYDGHLSVSDVIEAELFRIISLDPEAEVSFNVSVPVVKDGELLVGDLTALPVQELEQDATLDSVSVNIPFNTRDFRSGGKLEVAAFDKHVKDVLSLMTGDRNSSGQPEKNRNRTTSTPPVLNQSNCGGYPIGTTITVTTTSCSGTMITKYECMYNSTTGQNDWYVTQQEWLPEVNCINP